MKKQDILDKTYELIFVENRDVSFRKIAKELNISLGSINYHFDSKENLLVEVCKMYIMNNLKNAEDQGLIDLIYNINLGITNIKDNKKLALEIAYIIQSSVLPNVIDNVYEKFRMKYSELTKEKTAAIIIAIQAIAINDKLNDSLYKIDFNDKKDIKRLLDFLI